MTSACCAFGQDDLRLLRVRIDALLLRRIRERGGLGMDRIQGMAVQAVGSEEPQSPSSRPWHGLYMRSGGGMCRMERSSRTRRLSSVAVPETAERGRRSGDVRSDQRVRGVARGRPDRKHICTPRERGTRRNLRRISVESPSNPMRVAASAEGETFSMDEQAQLSHGRRSTRGGAVSGLMAQGKRASAAAATTARMSWRSCLGWRDTRHGR